LQARRSIIGDVQLNPRPPRLISEVDPNAPVFCAPKHHPLRIVGWVCRKESAPFGILLGGWQGHDARISLSLVPDGIVSLICDRYLRKLIISLPSRINGENLIFLILVQAEVPVILD
jgi:hypothetical protein